MSINRKLFVVFGLVAMMLLAATSSLAWVQASAPIDEPIYVQGDVYVPGYVVVESLDRVAGLMPHIRAVDRPDEYELYGSHLVVVPAGMEDKAIAALQAKGLHARRVPWARLYDTVPNDTYWDNQWGLRDIHAPAAWDLNKGDASDVICVVDTGIAVDGPGGADDHPDLDDKVLSITSTIGDNGYPSTGYAYAGHGTFVAGVAAAETNNATGIAGAGWYPKLRGVKISRGGYFPATEVAEGIDKCTEYPDVKVINFSGGSGRHDPGVHQAVTSAQQAGIIVVVSAGNANSPFETYPCAHADLCVAATDPDGRLSNFTNYGDWVNIAAPGGVDDPDDTNDIYSTWFYPDGSLGYAYHWGTSFSAPFVSGVAAVLLNNAGATPANVVAAITSTAVLAYGDNKSILNGKMDFAAALHPNLRDTQNMEYGCAPPQAEESSLGIRNNEASGSVNVLLRWAYDYTLWPSVEVRYHDDYLTVPAGQTVYQGFLTPLDNNLDEARLYLEWGDENKNVEIVDDSRQQRCGPTNRSVNADTADGYIRGRNDNYEVARSTSARASTSSSLLYPGQYHTSSGGYRITRGYFDYDLATPGCFPGMHAEARAVTAKFYFYGIGPAPVPWYLWVLDEAFWYRPLDGPQREWNYDRALELAPHLPGDSLLIEAPFTRGYYSFDFGDWGDIIGATHHDVYMISEKDVGDEAPAPNTYETATVYSANGYYPPILEYEEWCVGN